MSLIVRNICWFLGIFLMIDAMKHHAKFNAQGNANFWVGKIPKRIQDFAYLRNFGRFSVIHFEVTLPF